jgi:nucleoside-diphosphate-sugar epimerase
MRVLVVGATGVLGSRLVPLLTARGHQVTGTSRSAAKAGYLRSLGADPAALDVLDPAAVRATVAAARPDAIVYQATDLTGRGFSRNMDRGFAPTNRLRTAGTDNLLAAAEAAGVHRFIGQRGRVSPRWRTSTRRSPPRAGSRCATAASTAPRTRW